MSRWLPLLLLAAAGCSESVAPVPTTSTASGEPARVRVLHVLVSFRGAKSGEKMTRNQDEAEVLAKEILARAKRGEDFQKLMRDYSTDTGEGNYRLVNHGTAATQGETARANFLPGFTKVAFSLSLGDVGLAPYNPKDCYFGYHVIKRIE